MQKPRGASTGIKTEEGRACLIEGTRRYRGAAGIYWGLTLYAQIPRPPKDPRAPRKPNGEPPEEPLEEPEKRPPPKPPYEIPDEPPPPA